MTSIRIGKYACLEIERRYLLRTLPESLTINDQGWRIFDRYITGTRLRLRRMEALNGESVVYKFGQKYQSESQGPWETTMTNFYLDRAEYDRLLRLDGRDLRKTRYPFTHGDLTYGIDVFEGDLEGLILAEIECESLEMFENLPEPPAGWLDVTEDPSFTGGHLSGLSKGGGKDTVFPSSQPDNLNRLGVLNRREIEARILAPFVEALSEAMPREEVIAILRRTIIDVAREQGAALADRTGSDELEVFATTLDAWTRDDALEIEILEQSPEAFSFNVTRCRYAELYRSLGIPELGAVLSCNRDFSLIEGFNPDVELTRTQTIMEGASHCDFRYRKPADE